VLRSWIERAQRRFAPAASAGLVIGRDYVGFAHLAAAGGGWRVQTLTEVKFEPPLFPGAPSPQAAAALTQALQTLAGSLRRRYLPVHVSLPDAVVRWSTFELDQMPKTRAAQLDLVRFRFGRQGINGTHVFTCQPLQRDGDKYLLFGMAVDGAWLRCVNDALVRAGIVAWSLSANVCRQFNCFHDRVTQESGALVALAPDAWSLWLWDSQGRPRYARARWRTGPDDHADIALEVERSILAYVHGHPELTVACVFTVAGEEAGVMAGALDARLREPCARLSAEDAGVKTTPGTGSAALSSAAAMER
jgi:hypothetical protein